MPVIDNFDAVLEIQDAEKLRSLSCNGSMHPRIRGLLPEILDYIHNDGLCMPVISYEVIKVDTVKSGIFTLHGGKSLYSPLLSHKLARASHLVFGVTTIGNSISATISRWFAGGMHVKAFVLEEIANAFLFRVSEHLHTQIEEQALRMGLTASGPASPGDLEGFDINQQEVVLSLAGADKIGISKTSTHQMDPVHSISVVVGMGKRLQKWTRADNCNICRARDKCVHRRSVEEIPA